MLVHVDLVVDLDHVDVVHVDLSGTLLSQQQQQQHSTVYLCWPPL
jgi:hypothetical protein